jgi:hypothetical protein
MSSAASLDRCLAGPVLRCGHAPTALSLRCYGPRLETCMPGPSCRAPVADASWQSQLGCSCGSARATTSGLLLQCNDGAGRCSCSRKVVHEGLCSLPSCCHAKHACQAGSMEGRLGGCSTRAEQPLLVHAHKARTDEREAVVQLSVAAASVSASRRSMACRGRRCSKSCLPADPELQQSRLMPSLPQGHTSDSASTPRRATVGVLQCCCCCGVG